MSDEDDNTMSLNEEKFPNQNVSYPQNDGKSYIDLEEEDDDDDDGSDGVLRIGIDDYGGDGDTTDDDDDEPGDPQRLPKKRKLKTLLSSYEFARRIPASPSPPVPKPSYGGRNPLLDWTERETSVLLDAWGERYLKRGRKSLRSEEWQEVSEKVSQGSQIERTDTQCRNRLDTLKKKYKKEKAKLGENNGIVACKWIYFTKMDGLLSSPMPQAGLSGGMDVFTSPKAYLNQPNGVNEARDSPVDSGGDGEGESEGLPPKRGSNGVFKMLADSIHKFSEIYQKIELSKRQQMVELEKMRMDFHRDMDLQKRQILEKAQADIEKIWHGDDEDNDASPENVSG
ncbi:trihelix transcription factor ASIL1-like [Salvia hispanica]|uniref:trihelix transcription factor ASIL1-like n=1 Tax=Salvia hispanica TaxID=49212 RepID=UPI00200919B8|nr:trihelix transcription factor ASIL1-like [Salvia hispanica]